MDRELKRYLERAESELVPKMRASSVAVHLVPEGETDVKFALELGVAIMLDKPIIALVARGTRVPEKLLNVADEVIVYDTIEECQAELLAAITRLGA